MYKYITLALAAAASALPAPQSAGSVPSKDQEFGLIVKVDGTFVSLNAVTSGPETILVTERLSVYPGTPAYFVNFPPTVALNLDINGVAYGLKAPDVGATPGETVNVAAVAGYAESNWSVHNTTIYHEHFNSLNSFFVCPETVNGESNLVLKWGNALADGSAPEGCTATQIYMNCNIEGGLQC